MITYTRDVKLKELTGEMPSVDRKHLPKSVFPNLGDSLSSTVANMAKGRKSLIIPAKAE